MYVQQVRTASCNLQIVNVSSEPHSLQCLEWKVHALEYLEGPSTQILGLGPKHNRSCGY